MTRTITKVANSRGRVARLRQEIRAVADVVSVADADYAQATEPEGAAGYAEEVDDGRKHLELLCRRLARAHPGHGPRQGHVRGPMWWTPLEDRKMPGEVVKWVPTSQEPNDHEKDVQGVWVADQGRVWGLGARGRKGQAWLVVQAPATKRGA